ncbi:kinase-like protein [Thelephora ganbajun]|uniref:Kinase-like protein n=1 Tax=Thelephora ganbajun TaxID=370292 RepID=A0ACB6ZAZ9_THEGA|nr:kinase-like protein [Thelephora ganbajun]
MQFQSVFRQLIAKYNGDNGATTPGDVPLHDFSADRLRGGHAEVPHIVSEWRRLEQFDPKSREYLLLLTSLLNDRVNRKATTSLEGEDATIVLDILARVLDRGRNQGKLSSHTISVLRSLAYNACQVPNSYKINRSLDFDIDSVAFASGGFSDVWRGNLGGQPVAVKVMRMAQDSNALELQQHFCKETVLWKNISHPNILGLIAVEIDSRTGKCSMISELMVNGNIFHFIQLNSANRLRLLADAAEGLQYLHSHGIIHGDIKGPNILIANGTPHRACLSDFGFSTPAPTPSFVMTSKEMNLSGGTTPYMAPELIYPGKYGLDRSRVSREADIYAFGMVVYEVVMGVRPFSVENRRAEEVIFAVMAGERPKKPENLEAVGFGRTVWDLVDRCWVENRMQRPKTLDMRLCLTVAAAMSSSIPPGPRIAISLAQGNSTGCTAPSTYYNLFSDGREQTTPQNPGGGGGYGQDTRSIFEHSVLERSISVARQFVGAIQVSIPPTVRERFGTFERFQIRRFLNNFRARFNFKPPRNRRLHQD